MEKSPILEARGWNCTLQGFLVIYEHDEQELMGYGVNIS